MTIGTETERCFEADSTRCRSRPSVRSSSRQRTCTGTRSTWCHQLVLGAYRWSSYGVYLGRRTRPNWLHVDYVASRLCVDDHRVLVATRLPEPALGVTDTWAQMDELIAEPHGHSTRNEARTLVGDRLRRRRRVLIRIGGSIGSGKPRRRPHSTHEGPTTSRLGRCMPTNDGPHPNALDCVTIGV